MPVKEFRNSDGDLYFPDAFYCRLSDLEIVHIPCPEMNAEELIGKTIQGRDVSINQERFKGYKQINPDYFIEQAEWIAKVRSN